MGLDNQRAVFVPGTSSVKKALDNGSMICIGGRYQYFYGESVLGRRQTKFFSDPFECLKKGKEEEKRHAKQSQKSN